MNQKFRIINGLMLVLLTTAIGCTTPTANLPEGSDGGSCYEDGTCDEGLLCDASRICITTAGSCNDVDCSGHGICALADGQAICACDEGYHAEGLSCIEDGSHGSCADIDCSGHGICEIDNEQATCRCDEGYYAEELSCLEETQVASLPFGPRPVESTPIGQGTIFAGPTPTGTGDCLSADNCCDLQTAMRLLQDGGNGNVLFLRGGTYSLDPVNFPIFRITRDGTESAPIIIESYPGELATIEGSQILPESTNSGNYNDLGGLRLKGDYTHLRKIEVKRMPTWGVHVQGAECLIEGLESHHNYMTGLSLYNSQNTILRDSTFHHNTDKGYSNYPHADGDNGDGFGAASSEGALIEYCDFYYNGDDGADTFNHNELLGDVIIRRCLAHHNGYYWNGSEYLSTGFGGIGIKLGKGTNNTANKNLVYLNRSVGISYNAGIEIVMTNNTSWNNFQGYAGGGSTIMERNISAGNTDTATENGDGWISDKDLPPKIDNSWNAGYEEHLPIVFVSTDPTSPDFLRPVAGGPFEDIGAWSGE